MKPTIQFIIYTAVVIITGLAGCSRDERLMYQEDSRVYFYKSVRGFQANADSTIYNFGVYSDTWITDTVYLTFRIMGTAVDRDRTINIIAEDSSTAKPGYHYAFGPLVMPANEYQTDIPVYLYRKPGLKDSVVNLYLTIGESEDFKPGYTDKASAGYKLDRLHYKITLTDQLLKPTIWDNYWVNYFGAYSKVKFLFMIQATGKTDWNSYALPQETIYLSQQARLALLEYEQANGPMYDENGDRVVFP